MRNSHLKIKEIILMSLLTVTHDYHVFKEASWKVLILQDLLREDKWSLFQTVMVIDQNRSLIFENLVYWNCNYEDHLFFAILYMVSK